MRVGDWKAVRQRLAAKPQKIKTELYNLRDDPAERADIAAGHPHIVKQLETLMREQHTMSDLFPLPGIDAP